MLIPAWQQFAAIYASILVSAPLLLRATFKFSARCNPVPVGSQEVPPMVQGLVGRCAQSFEALGFSLVGYFDLGSLAPNTRSYIAYFAYRSLGTFANVSVVSSPVKTAGYFEFSSSFANGLTLDTNTNGSASLTPPQPDILIFRFPEIFDATELFQIHRRLIQKHARGLQPRLPAEGQEASRIKAQVELFGQRQARSGYMYLGRDGSAYRLTWKGAFLMGWKSVWPISPIRTSLYQSKMKQRLRSLGQGGIASV